VARAAELANREPGDVALAILESLAISCCRSTAISDRRYSRIASVMPLMSSEMCEAGNEIVTVICARHHVLRWFSEMTQMLATDSYPQLPEPRSVAEADAEACWMAGIQAGNREALEQIYCRYSGQVVQFLSLVEPGLSPEEACLDIFEELWHGAAAGLLRGALVDCIFRLAYRVLLQRALATERLACAADTAPNPNFDVLSAIGALSWEQRVVVALVYGIGLPQDSISNITAMTDREITGHFSEARDRLRMQMPR
jgi:DNA-directed RNA polymerase specialized sigma24 family protein